MNIVIRQKALLHLLSCKKSCNFRVARSRIDSVAMLSSPVSCPNVWSLRNNFVGFKGKFQNPNDTRSENCGENIVPYLLFL